MPSYSRWAFHPTISIHNLGMCMALGEMTQRAYASHDPQALPGGPAFLRLVDSAMKGPVCAVCTEVLHNNVGLNTAWKDRVASMERMLRSEFCFRSWRRGSG